MQNEQPIFDQPLVEWDCQIEDDVIIHESMQSSLSQINSSEYGANDNQYMIETETKEELNHFSDDEEEEEMPVPEKKVKKNNKRKLVRRHTADEIFTVSKDIS